MRHALDGSEDRRIVVGVDGSEPSKTALRWAARQAELTGSDLEVVMVWKEPHATYGIAPASPPELDMATATERRLEQLVENVLGGTGGAGIALYTAAGPVAQTLLREAKGEDLLVVGSRGHKALVGMLLGSVSEHCATHAHCPVVVVH